MYTHPLMSDNSGTEEGHFLRIYFLCHGLKPGRSGIYSLKGAFFIGFRHLPRWGVDVSLSAIRVRAMTS